jgi:capsular polysaccharide biosynthesis protein
MASPLILPFVTEDAYAQWAGAPQQVLCEAERVEGAPPAVFPQDETAYYGAAALTYDFPAVTLTTLKDIVVRGRSNVLTAPEAVIRHRLFDPDREVIPEEFYGRLALVRAQGSAAWMPTDPFNVDYLPEAAAFTDGSAFNYAHWMTEVLPRLAAFVGHGAHASVPLIVDADLHPNIMRSIALVAGPEAPIYPLAPDALVRVGVLHNVSPAGYVPFKLREQPIETICHGLFGGAALRASVGRVRRQISAGDGRPRLLVRRNSTLRRLVNEAEIEDALTGLGFVPIEPERLTLEEQAAAFSQAGMVLGATGAAMANLMFCRPDCPVVVLMPKFRHTAYWYWRRISAAAGAGPVVHVSGAQTETTEDPFDALAVHQDFRVEVKDVLDAVAAAAALSG